MGAKVKDASVLRRVCAPLCGAVVSTPPRQGAVAWLSLAAGAAQKYGCAASFPHELGQGGRDVLQVCIYSTLIIRRTLYI